MKITEFYEKIGADYTQMYDRMVQREDLILKFLKKYLTDPTFSKLEEVVSANSTADDIFRVAHTFKGIVSNLELKPLMDAVHELVEITRDGETDGVKESFEKIKNSHFEILKLIESIE